MDKAVALFDPDTLADDLTPGGLRYLTHAIRPGTPIASAAVLTFSGKVRLKPTGPWMPFRATETIHAGCSFRVTANARRGPIRATIEDTYDSTGARARVHAFGIIPVRSQSGPGPHPFRPRPPGCGIHLASVGLSAGQRSAMAGRPPRREGHGAGSWRHRRSDPAPGP